VKSGLYPSYRRIMDTEKKPAVKSFSIWGSLLNLLPVGLLLEKSLDLPSGVFDQLLTSGQAAYVAVVGLAGVLMTIYGRLKANPNISGIFKVKE
jgi:hypothetical protein